MGCRYLRYTLAAEVDATMKSVPEGRLITINQIREIMAKKYNDSYG